MQRPSNPPKIIKIGRPCLWTKIWSLHDFLWDKLLTTWIVPIANVKWHSEVRPVTVTSQPIWLYTKFLILIPKLTFTELWEASMDHLQWWWHAFLFFKIPGSVHRFGLEYALLVETIFSQFCRDFLDFFTSNIHRYFLDFARFVLEFQYVRVKTYFFYFHRDHVGQTWLIYHQWFKI